MSSALPGRSTSWGQALPVKLVDWWQGLELAKFYMPPGWDRGYTSALIGTYITAAPFDLQRGGTISGLLLELVTAGSAGSLTRMGIWADNGTGYYPGALLVDGGEVDSSVTGYADLVATISLAVTPQKLWIGAHTKDVTTEPTFRRVSYDDKTLGVTGMTDGGMSLVYATLTYGAFATTANPFPAGAGQSNAPWRVGIRFSALS